MPPSIVRHVFRTFFCCFSRRFPAVFDLALPLALMIAVYRIVLRRREDRELLVLSGAGIGSARFVWWAMAIGLAAQLVSLAVSGVI